MKQIKLNDKVALDLPKLIAGKMLLQAGSGGGKSYAIRRILEQSFGEIPHLILDTEGEFSSLREKYDYILIGKGFDINADPKTAALLALRLWEERVSAIIDLYELSPWDRQVFVKNFVDALINAPKKLWKPVLLIIDEAHEYAPESDKSDSGRALHLLASKGRKRHIGAIFATQRISSLSKNIVASCKNKLIGYASETNDVKRAAFELGFTPAEARSLRDLDPGEFYAFGPALTKEVTKIKIGSVKTSHENGATQNNEGNRPPSKKVLQALAKLADLPQAAAEEARTVSELKAEINTLKRQNQQKIVQNDPKEVEKAVLEAVRKAGVEWEKVVKNWQVYVQKHFASFKEAIDFFEKMEKPATIPPNWLTPSNLKTAVVRMSDQRDFVKLLPVMTRPGKVTPGTENMMSELEPFNPVTGGERKILIALGQHPDGMTRAHITVQADYKQSARDTYISRLKSRGFVEQTDNKIKITQGGINELGEEYNPNPPTGMQMRDLMLRTLSGGELKIFELLLHNEEGYTRLEITEKAGYQQSARDTYISRLKTRELIKSEGGRIMAIPLFFE